MINKIKIILKVSRPISWVNSAYPFAAGYSMMGGKVDLTLILGFLFFLIPYNITLYGINDIFDYESDVKNPRKGGVEGLVLDKKYHKLVLNTSFLTCLPFVLYFVVIGNLVSTAILSLSLFFVVAYSYKYLRFKEVPYIDSFTSSMHFVMPLIFAYSLTSFNETAILIAISFTLWGMASHSFGAIQDIIPDKKAKINSIATKMGANQTIYYSAILYFLSSLTLFKIGSYAIASGVFILFYWLNVLRFYKVTDKTSEKTRKGWKLFLIMNYILGSITTISLIIYSIS